MKEWRERSGGVARGMHIFPMDRRSMRELRTQADLYEICESTGNLSVLMRGIYHSGLRKGRSWELAVRDDVGRQKRCPSPHMSVVGVKELRTRAVVRG